MTPRATNLATKPIDELEELIDASAGRGENLSFPTSETQRRCANVLGVQVEALDMTLALARIESALAERRKGYVCMAGVHGIMEAQRDPALKKAFAQSLMTAPDGTPAVWVGRWQGLKWMQRVTGPDLMLEVFRRKQFARYTHFLYGGKEGVAQDLAVNLSRRFPWARVVGTCTPPFRELNLTEQERLISRIRSLKPSIIWIGISTPRQEMFMQRYLPMFDTSLMFGVGAAFDFHTGRIKDCADWIKRAGLQWLHRLLQDPRRLLWRYLRNNPAFVWRIAMQFAGFGPPAETTPENDPPKKRSLLRESTTDLR